jgi:hypothetical protein
MNVVKDTEPCHLFSSGTLFLVPDNFQLSRSRLPCHEISVARDMRVHAPAVEVDHPRVPVCGAPDDLLSRERGMSVDQLPAAK